MIHITPFTGTIDDPSRLKQMALVKAPLISIMKQHADTGSSQAPPS